MVIQRPSVSDVILIYHWMLACGLTTLGAWLIVDNYTQFLFSLGLVTMGLGLWCSLLGWRLQTRYPSGLRSVSITHGCIAVVLWVFWLFCVGACIYFYNRHLKGEWLADLAAYGTFVLSVAAFILACWSAWVMRRFAALSALASIPNEIG